MDPYISQLQSIADRAREVFGEFSAEQLNFRADAKSWSVGQCFDHLIKTNELYYGELDKIAAGTRKNSFWENWSPLTSLGGRFLIKTLRSDDKKLKAPTRAIVPPSNIDAKIIETFCWHQAELIEKINRAEDAAPKKVVLTSPFLSAMTYSLADGLTSIVEHEKRHFRQAERVCAAPDFPKQ